MMTLLICLLLIGFVAAIAIGTQGREPDKQFEPVQIPVSISKRDRFIGRNLRRWEMQPKLIHFLREDLGIPAQQIRLGLRQVQQVPNQLPMVLWQYGLISLGQLEQVFDWLETAPL